MSDNDFGKSYTYEQFILYLYIAAAYADYQLKAEEIQVIREKMAGMIDPEIFDETFYHVWQDIQSHNDIETMEHIEKCCRDLNFDKEERLRIYQDFQDIILADGDEDESERVNMFKFRKLLRLEPGEA